MIMIKLNSITTHRITPVADAVGPVRKTRLQGIDVEGDSCVYATFFISPFSPSRSCFAQKWKQIFRTKPSPRWPKNRFTRSFRFPKAYSGCTAKTTQEVVDTEQPVPLVPSRQALTECVRKKVNFRSISRHRLAAPEDSLSRYETVSSSGSSIHNRMSFEHRKES